ncbi:MAG: relaxase, partial [Ferruginibacter sp.]
ISNIVTAVFTQYKFSSMPEFNAALKQFNIIADRGKEEGRIYKKRGLVYRILNADGIKVGVPIKASSISCKPILQNLEQKYVVNETAKQPLKQRTKSVIDECLLKSPGNIMQLINDLKQKNIYTVLRKNEEGRLFGITFVDNQNKCVFNGSDLGKGYSIAALQSKITAAEKEALINIKDTGSSGGERWEKKIQPSKFQDNPLKLNYKKESLLDILLPAKEQLEYVPANLLKKKRKKKKRKDNNF